MLEVIIMLYNKFVNWAIAYDERNIFEKHIAPLNLDAIPNFYRFYTPLDVEISFNGSSLRFIPASELEAIAKEYNYLDFDFLFATSNGDPFFIKDNSVYTCSHGTATPNIERIANSFDDFLRLIMENNICGNI